MSPDAHLQYQKWKDAGYSDAEIQEAGSVAGGTWYLGPPPGEGALPSNLFEAHPPPPQGDPSGLGHEGMPWNAYYTMLASEYGISYEEAKEHDQALLGIQSAGPAAAGFFEE